MTNKNIMSNSENIYNNKGQVLQTISDVDTFTETIGDSPFNISNKLVSTRRLEKSYPGKKFDTIKLCKLKN